MPPAAMSALQATPLPLARSAKKHITHHPPHHSLAHSAPPSDHIANSAPLPPTVHSAHPGGQEIHARFAQWDTLAPLAPHVLSGISPIPVSAPHAKPSAQTASSVLLALPALSAHLDSPVPPVALVPWDSPALSATPASLDTT